MKQAITLQLGIGDPGTVFCLKYAQILFRPNLGAGKGGPAPELSGLLGHILNTLTLPDGRLLGGWLVACSTARREYPWCRPCVLGMILTRAGLRIMRGVWTDTRIKQTKRRLII